jgi:ribonuclease D
MYGDTPLIMVEDAAALEEAVAYLVTQPVIGLDTEADSFHHYREKLCLIQISDAHRDYIIDPLQIDDLSPLKAVLENTDIVKVLHGADYDVVSIKRDTGVAVHNIFDTMISSQFLGMERIGLADLILRYFGHTLDKRYQRHDWADRPLGDDHLHYARGDTHWLVALREVLTYRLQQAGRVDALLEECTLLEDREWAGRGQAPTDFYRVKNARSLDTLGLKVLRGLWAYRDACAAELDRPAFKVLPDPILILLAAKRPHDIDGVYDIMRRGSAMARRHAEPILTAIRAAILDETPLPDWPKAEGRPKAERNANAPSVDRVMVLLKAWRNEVVAGRGLSPVVVANNNLLKEIARCGPRTMEELAAVPGIRQWQLKEHGETILAAINSIEVKPARRRRRRRH